MTGSKVFMLMTHLVKRAAGEPGVVVEVVVHRAQAGILQEVGYAGWRPAISGNMTLS